MKPLLEIAVFNVASALIADKAGADRIELCHDFSTGGITPSINAIKQAKAETTAPLFVMIRPRGGDFSYNSHELSAMKYDLIAAKALGVNGFVFGVLDDHRTINVAANEALIRLAHPLPCTFHRAFDTITNKQAALDTLISCGFQRVLTSGGIGNAMDHCDELGALVRQANGRIVVMPGGGIRTHNIGTIKTATHATEYHSAAIIEPGELANAHAIIELKRLLTS